MGLCEACHPLFPCPRVLAPALGLLLDGSEWFWMDVLALGSAGDCGRRGPAGEQALGAPERPGVAERASPAGTGPTDLAVTPGTAILYSSVVLCTVQHHFAVLCRSVLHCTCGLLRSP